MRQADDDALVLALDEGSTGVRAMLLDRAGTPQGIAYREALPDHPGPGLVEHDAEALFAATVDVVRQVLYLVRIGGIDHVAIGSDFEGDITPPAELSDASTFPRLAAALEKAGLSREEVTKIFSANALRVLCPGAPPLKK